MIYSTRQKFECGTVGMLQTLFPVNCLVNTVVIVVLSLIMSSLLLFIFSALCSKRDLNHLTHISLSNTTHRSDLQYCMEDCMQESFTPTPSLIVGCNLPLLPPYWVHVIHGSPL